MGSSEWWKIIEQFIEASVVRNGFDCDSRFIKRRFLRHSFFGVILSYAVCEQTTDNTIIIYFIKW